MSKRFNRIFAISCASLAIILTLFSGLIKMEVNEAASISEDDYIGMTEYFSNGHALYVQRDGGFEEEEKLLVYCYNRERMVPDYDDYYELPKYKRKIATEQVLTNLTDSNNKLTGAELKNAIQTVIYNGYGVDSLNLQQQFQLTDYQFYEITQQAVWYHTEQPDERIPSKLNELGNVENVKRVYSILINKDEGIKPKAPPVNTNLYIYESQNKKYQNLLGVTFYNSNTNKKETDSKNNVSPEWKISLVKKGLNAQNELVNLTGAEISVLNSKGSEVAR